MPQDTITTAPPPQEEAPKRTYMGRLRPPPAGWTSGPPEAGLDDMLGASFENTLVNQNFNSGEVALEEAYARLITKGREAGLNVKWNPIAEYRVQWGKVDQQDLISKWHEEVGSQLAANPDLQASLGPVSREAIAGMADQLSRDAQTRYLELKERRGEDFWSLDTLAEFGVGMGAALLDPGQAATAGIGGPSKTILGAAVKGAALNAGIEAALQPVVQGRQLQIGNIENWEEGVANGLTNVTIAGALGFVLSGGGKAADKVLFEPGRTRTEAARIESERKFDHARESMQALAAVTAPTDPESAAIVRAALSNAEREYATVRQAPDSIEPDEFATRVEQADDFLRRMTEFVERPEPRRADPPAERLDITDDGPTPKVGDALVEDGKPVAFQSFNPRELGVAPDEMQYKRFSGEEGVNGAIADVETWHAPSSGKILVFERANGERVIADGHQRRSKAIGIMDAQGREDIRLDGYLYREVDGWTVADLRLKGAQKNIREGRSDVLDTAQALRERPDAIDSSFPLSRSNIRQARQLARLAPEAWDLTRAGVLEPQYAALIGQVAPDRPAIHAPLARTLIEAAPENIRQAENIVSEALLDYAERSVETQASLFGDDNLGRAVMYRERAQIMDAAYAWLRSERSVFKALVDKGDIARALGNELVDAANLNAKDQVELAIAAVMHSRKAGVRTAVTDMISRALDSVRREGVTPARAGQQVAREIRALVEERGFRALLDAEGPAPPQFAEAGPLFDGPGSKAHAEQADMLEGDLRPEGIEDPGVKLADAVQQPDEVTSLVDELKGAGQGGGDRTPDQILNDIRKLLKPAKEGEAKGPPSPADAMKEVEAQVDAFAKAESQLRYTLVALTDAQKLSLIRMQYPDAYPWLNRLAGAELDDAIVGRVMAGEVKFAKRGDILVLDLPTDQRIFSPGQPDDLGFVTSAEQALANPPPRFRDAKALSAEQWRKLMREGGASKEAFTYQIEPALKMLADEGVEGDIPRAKFEEALARNRKTMTSVIEEKGGVRGPTSDEPGYRTEDDYSTYVAPGPHSRYIQEVLVLPGLDYRSHNWRTPGAIGHIRTTQRRIAGGKSTLHVEELQSDLHQEGAKYGYKGEGGVTDAQFADARKAASAAGRKLSDWLENSAVGNDKKQSIWSASSYLKDPIGRELAREFEAATARMDAMAGTLTSKHGKPVPPRAPMENWEEPFVRNALQTAAREGYEIVTFPTHATLHSALQNEGTKAFYDQRLPATLARVAKSLGLKVETVEIKFGTGKERVDPNNGETFAENGIGTRSVPAIRLTPEASARLRNGVVMYSRGESRIGMDVQTARKVLTQEFGDGANALGRVGELNITDRPPVWAAPDTMGITDAQGRVTLYAANVAPEDLRGLVLHEVGVHAGLDRILGVAGKQRLLDDLGERMRAIAPDHPLWAGAATGSETRFAKRGQTLQFEPLSRAAADDLLDLTPDQWAAEIKASKYAAYRLPEGVAEADLPKGYVVVLTGEAAYAVRADNLRDREAAGATVTEVDVEVAVDPAPRATDKSLLAAMNRVPLDTDRAHVVEETLAYLVQHAPKHTFVQRMLAEVRAWLYRTFPKMQEWMTLTEADMVSLAMGAVRQRIREANRAVSYGSARSGGVFSTTGVRYARRPRNEQNPDIAAGRSLVSGQPDKAGQPDVGGRGGSGAAAEQGAAAGSGAQPARAVESEPLPPAPVSQGGWNSRVELTPDQRASRKEQFRSFVESAEVTPTSTRIRTDWLFKNGKRYGGPLKHVESVRYTVATREDMHASWMDALDEDETRLTAEVHGGEATIHDSHVAKALRSTGLGEKIYRTAIDDLLARGLIVNSDVSMSENAIALWKSLRDKGYDVVQRVPGRLLKEGRDGQKSLDDMTALFYVTRKKPPAPDLPVSERDIANKIDEARNLSEHIPSCIKGK